MNIHATAIVGKKAKLSGDVEVGSYVLIEDNVDIGKGVKVYSHAHILNNTTIGDNCQVHIGAVLGHLPQIRQNTHSSGKLIIGQGNIFREYSTVHRSSQNQKATLIGDNNYFMAFSHVAHDCHIGNHVTICNGTLVAGHGVIEDFAFISGNVTVHQFCRIGKYSMIGGLTRVAKDVPPYMLVKGDSTVWAINSVGLRRAMFSISIRNQIKKAFKILYKSGLSLSSAIKQLQSEFNSKEIAYLINFILHSQRGICAYRNSSFWQRVRLSSLMTKFAHFPAHHAFQQYQKMAFNVGLR